MHAGGRGGANKERGREKATVRLTKPQKKRSGGRKAETGQN